MKEEDQQAQVSQNPTVIFYNKKIETTYNVYTGTAKPTKSTKQKYKPRGSELGKKWID
jgi:hypothetical protein